MRRNDSAQGSNSRYDSAVSRVLPYHTLYSRLSQLGKSISVYIQEILSIFFKMIKRPLALILATWFLVAVSGVLSGFVRDKANSMCLSPLLGRVLPWCLAGAEKPSG
jgi:hypothetical protein